MTLSELYVGCRTYRRFKQDPIPDEVINAILENVRIASCGMNAQNLRFICAKSPETVAKIQPYLKWAGALPREIGTPKEGEQPTAVIAVIKKKGHSPLVIDIDVGIAVNVIATTAWESGVGSCIIYSVNRNEVAKIIGVEEGDEIALVVALGYPSHKSTIVPLPEDGSIKYYVDENRDYYVPKRALEDVAKIV